MENKQPETLTVRIEKCDKLSFWYANKIGSEFIVAPHSSENWVLYSDHLAFLKDEKRARFLILKKDCTVLPLTSDKGPLVEETTAVQSLKWEDLKGNLIAVECYSYEEISLVDRRAFNEYIPQSYNDDDEGFRCYSLYQPRTYGSVRYFEDKGYTIIPAKDFIAANPANQPAGKEEGEKLLDAQNDIDVVGNCANCGVEYHIHKPSPVDKEAQPSGDEAAVIKILERYEKPDADGGEVIRGNSYDYIAEEICALIASKERKAVEGQLKNAALKFIEWKEENQYLMDNTEQRVHTDDELWSAFVFEVKENITSKYYQCFY